MRSTAPSRPDPDTGAELRSVYEITELIQSTTDTAAIFETVLQKLAEASQANGMALSLVDAETDRLVVVATHNVSLDGDPTFIPMISACACKQALNLGQVIHSSAELEFRDCPLCQHGPSISIPVKGAERVRGVITLLFDQVEALPPAVELMAQTVATQLGLALDRLELQALQSQSRRTLTLLDDLSYTLAEQLSASQLVSTTLELLSKHFPADVTTFVLYDVGRDEIDIAGQVVADRHKLPQPVIKLMMDWLIRTRSTIWLPFDVPLEGAGPVEPEEFELGETPASLIAAPLMINDRLLGGIILASFKPQALTESHAQIITALANQIAGGLEVANLTLADQANLEKLESLYAASQVLTCGLRIDNVLEIFLDIVAALADADFAIFFEIDKDRQRLLAQTYRGFDHAHDEIRQFQTIPLDRGLNGRACSTGQVVNVPDVRLEADYLEINTSTRSELIIPLVYDEEVLGTFDLESPRVGAFDDIDLDILIALAGQAATAMANAELRAVARNGSYAISSLEASAAALVGELDVVTLARVICRAALESCQGAMGWIGLIDGEDAWVEPLAVVGHTSQTPGSLRLRRDAAGNSRHPIGKAIVDRQLVVLQNLTSAPEETAGLEMAAEEGYQALAAVPMLYGRQVVGVLTVYSYRVNGFSGQHLDLLQAFASQAAFAIKTVQSLKRLMWRNRDLATLYSVVEVAAGHHSADALDEVLTKITRGLKFDVGLVYRLEEGEAGSLRLAGHVGLTAASAEELRRMPLQSDASVQQVIETAKPAFFEDEPYVLGDVEYRARTVIPLLSGECVSGVVLLAQRQPRRFQVADTITLVTIGRVLGLSLASPAVDETPWPLLRPAANGNGQAPHQSGAAEGQAGQPAPEHLLRVERLSTLSKLISGVAYELNNPLTSVIGYAQLLERQLLPPEAIKDITRVRQEAQRCARIVGNLLSFARRFSLDKTQIVVNDLVNDVVDLWRYEFHLQGIHLNLDLPSESPQLVADGHQLQLMLINLISNATHALSATQGDKQLSIAVSPAENQLTLTVADNGPGIPEDQLGAIFEPFYTTRLEGMGTGLGLSICQMIVQQHQGTIRVESEPGQGATFIVELPIAEAAQEPAAGVAQPQPEPAPVRGRKVLVVDDEATLLDLAQRVLSNHGHQVDTALSGTAALDLVDHSDFDLIISDLRMPEMDGLAFKRELEKRYAGNTPPILFITGDGLSETLHTCFEKEDIPYLVKPFTIDELNEAVNGMLM